MKNKITILIASTFVLLLMWRLFDLSHDKIDLFLFYDLKQSIKWYAYYTFSVYGIQIVMTHIIHLLVSKHYAPLKPLSLFLVIFTWIRLAVYWLFRGSINLEVSVACILIYCLYELGRQWRK